MDVDVMRFCLLDKRVCYHRSLQARQDSPIGRRATAPGWRIQRTFITPL